MSATVISDPVVVSSPETQPAAPKISAQNEVDSARCECCGFTEECTPEYIERIRKRNQGRWICGLCSEAVKDEIVRSERLITMEEALNRHINFCKSGSNWYLTVQAISAMKELLKRSSDSPRALRSTPSSPMRKGESEPGPALSRSESCFPTISSG